MHRPRRNFFSWAGHVDLIGELAGHTFLAIVLTVLRLGLGMSRECKAHGGGHHLKSKRRKWHEMKFSYEVNV